MSGLANRVKALCGAVGVTQPVEGVTDLPHDYLEVVRLANGFCTRDGTFRLFGTARFDQLPSVFEWNTACWRKSYGQLFEGLFIVAEDIFGDQYGYGMGEAATGPLLKIRCEGGERCVLSGNLATFLVNSVLSEVPTAYDYDLVTRAFEAGLRPNKCEHLAFVLPLIANGEYDVSNLHVESTALHLGTLGQMSLLNREFEDGTPIRRFG